jgi:hypothetical protein
MRSSMLGAVLSVLLGACGARATQQRPPMESSATPAPRLVVVVVFDQLAEWTLARYEQALDANGAIRSVSAAGVRTRVRFPYASTVTACGHTAIFTGAPPSVTGVIANEVYDRDRGRTVSAFDDGEHAVLGAPGTFGSPRAMRAETIADALDEATRGAARIVSVSLKDRGAIPGGGERGDAVVWYDVTSGRFTTSTAYAEAIPAWLGAWSTENPVESTFEPWEAHDPSLLGRIAGPDDGPGEGDYQALGTTFPHVIERSTNPRAAMRVAPRSSEMLLSLAEAASREHGLGEDDVPDLLAISISGTDYAGHVYGPSSWEYLDHLIRADRALGALLRRLGDRTSLAVLITSDHGVAAMPESSHDDSPVGRIADADIVRAAEAAIDEAIGDGDWVDAFVEPYLYLSEAAEEPSRRERATAAAVAALDALPSVDSVHDVRDAARLVRGDALEQAVGLSLHEDGEGDVYVVPAQGFVFDPGMPGRAGTNHGSPWDHDRVVPAIFAGPGVSPAPSQSVFDQRRVAPTISALLGVAPPEHATARPLPGALRPARAAE